MTRRILVMLALAAGFAGCAKPCKKPYYFGDYSERYYAYKKNKSPESIDAMKRSIEATIAARDNNQSAYIPPGMYASLGYLYLQQGDALKASELFILEKTTYPESAHFMNRLLRQIEQKLGEQNE